MRALCTALPLAALTAVAARAADFAPLCPHASILRDAADLTQFRGAGTDLTDMVVDGRITGLGGKCELDDPTHLRTHLNVTLELTRGPASASRTIDVMYFVSVTKGDAILAKQQYRLAAAFPANADTVRLQGDPVDLVLPVDAKTTGESYSVLTGFQLSPAQLAFNRQRGVR